MKEALWFLLLTNGRLNRRGFWLYFGPLFALAIGRPLLGIEPVMVESGLLFWGIALILVYTQFSVLIKRFHDFGLSGWWSILWLVPVINVGVLIYCGFFPGNSEANKFGNYRFMANA
jgi:uncharacterized membrane protein YhaH (DUF805 family)